MKDNYDFSKAVKNPYAEDLKKNGYTVMINYGAKRCDCGNAGEYEPSPDEIPAFEEYDKKAQSGTA